MKATIFSIVKAMSLVIAIMFFTSCDSEYSDTTPPVITLNSPAEGAVLLIGDSHGIHFDMDVVDNQMLASYKVDIHSNFDGHGHSRSNDGETVDFSFERSWDLTGQKNAKVHHHEIVIPENATPGNYHLMVYCTDTDGNEAYLARSIVLSHDGESGHH